ncbi:MAG: glycoside hydrolase family 3 protein, partial [Anaeroplasmataceae bacterium]
MINLKAKPFNLKDEDIKWINDTIKSMTLDEKVGQLFIGMTGGTDDAMLKEYFEKSKIGGARYMGSPSKASLIQNNLFQKHSKIPLLVACNVESGGNGACVDGTEVGHPVKIGATNDTKYAYELGKVCGIEAAATNSNWAFAPIVDITYNWRNPVISSRAYSNEPKKVLEMSKAYFKGISESNIMCAMKHFPGDGVDERDHHLSSAVNTLSTKEWDETFGLVYKGLIDEGVQAVMAGHIMLPSYQKHFNKNVQTSELLPATLCKELLQDLLREKLGFNGLIITDASHMVGMTGRMKRSEYVPLAIKAGCDMFLFFNSVEEDTKYMKDAIESGFITAERLNDALTRILALKATLGLHKLSKEELQKPESGLKNIGLESSINIAKEISDKAITLAKNTQNVLPISPKKTKKVLLVPLGKEAAPSMIGLFMGTNNKKTPDEIFKELLEKEGFQVTVYEDP